MSDLDFISAAVLRQLLLAFVCQPIVKLISHMIKFGSEYSNANDGQNRRNVNTECISTKLAWQRYCMR